MSVYRFAAARFRVGRLIRFAPLCGRQQMQTAAGRAFVAMMLCLAALLLGCGPAATRTADSGQPGEAPPKRLARPPARSLAGYVGSSACVQCHKQIAEQYSQHPMAISVHPVLRQPIENYDQAQFSPINVRKYVVEKQAEGEKQGEQVLHHELGIDAEGQTIYDQAAPVHYAIGSGRRGRSYLIERDGLLFLSPISWYSTSRRWDLSPQYQALSSPRFDRPAFERCLHCHAGQMNYISPPDSELVQRYQTPPFAEMAIGCERCHGPGREHIAYRRLTGEERGDKPDPIVHPSRLSPAKRDAVCNQCHLHGEAMVLRYGRTHVDFRPGDHLGDIWSAFVAGEGVDASNKTRAVSQGEQMLSSACYLKSNGKLGCTSCHDPHQMPPEETKTAFFNDRCAECHQEQSCSLPEKQRSAPPANGSCISCHMPALDASDIPHTTQTDHRILRRPLAKSKAAASDEAPDPRKFTIFDEALRPLSPLEKDRAQGLMLAQMAELQADPELAKDVEKLLRPVSEAAPDDVDVIDALGVAASLQGRLADAARLWRSAVTIEPRRQKPLFSLAALAQGEGNLPTALVYEERLLELNPWEGSLYLRHSKTLSGLGRADDALAAAEKAIELDPSSPEAHAWVAELHQMKGDLTKADEARRQARRLTPPRPPSSGEGSIPATGDSSAPSPPTE